MKADTTAEYQQVVAQCRDIFDKKMQDYGAAWRIMRTESLTDQIFIKANRIRSLQRMKEHLVNEGIEPEFIGIINYSAMAIIQLQLGVVEQPDLTFEKASELYTNVLDGASLVLSCLVSSSSTSGLLPVDSPSSMALRRFMVCVLVSVLRRKVSTSTNMERLATTK